MGAAEEDGREDSWAAEEGWSSRGGDTISEAWVASTAQDEEEDGVLLVLVYEFGPQVDSG